MKSPKISETTSSVLSSHPKNLKTTQKTLTSHDRILFLTPLGWLDASLGCCGIVPPRLKSNGKNLEIVWENELDLLFLGHQFRGEWIQENGPTMLEKKTMKMGEIF